MRWKVPLGRQKKKSLRNQIDQDIDDANDAMDNSNIKLKFEIAYKGKVREMDY